MNLKIDETLFPSLNIMKKYCLRSKGTVFYEFDINFGGEAGLKLFEIDK